MPAQSSARTLPLCWAAATGPGTTGKLGRSSRSISIRPRSRRFKIAVGNLNSFLAFPRSLPVLYAGDETGLRSYSIDRATGKPRCLNEATTSGGPLYISGSHRKVRPPLLVLQRRLGGSVLARRERLGRKLGRSREHRREGAASCSIPKALRLRPCNLGSDGLGALLRRCRGLASAAEPPEHFARGRTATLSPSRRAATAPTSSASSTARSRPSATPATASFRTRRRSGTPLRVTRARSPGRHSPHAGRQVPVRHQPCADESTLGMYAVGSDGKLSPIGFENSRGSTPRNFAIHPGGFAARRQSGLEQRRELPHQCRRQALSTSSRLRRARSRFWSASWSSRYKRTLATLAGSSSRIALVARAERPPHVVPFLRRKSYFPRRGSRRVAPRLVKARISSILRG